MTGIIRALLISGMAAGCLTAALVASGVPPWFMVAHSAGDTFPGLLDANGEPTDEAGDQIEEVQVVHRAAPEGRSVPNGHGVER